MKKTKTEQTEINKLAKIIWNYLCLKQKLAKADLILVLCSIDLRIAEYAASLYKRGFAPFLVFSGGKAHSSDLLATNWKTSEAEKFAGIAKKKGVPTERILLETRAENTGENILFTYKLLQNKKIKYKNLILLQKPYMTRRTVATFLKQWPDKKTKFIVTTPRISFERYCQNKKDKEKIINIMVGDLQRITEYPKLGFQVEQRIPVKVLGAYEKLIKYGYIEHLIK